MKDLIYFITKGKWNKWCTRSATFNVVGGILLFILPAWWWIVYFFASAFFAAMAVDASKPR